MDRKYNLLDKCCNFKTSRNFFSVHVAYLMVEDCENDLSVTIRIKQMKREINGAKKLMIAENVL